MYIYLYYDRHVSMLYGWIIAVRPADPPSASRRCDTVPPSGEGSDIKKSKNVTKNIVYTSGEGPDTKMSKKRVQKK